MSWTSFVREAASVETDRLKAQARAAFRSMVLSMVAAVFLVIGVVFALVGAYASLSETMEPWQAGGLVGLGALVICFILLMMAKSSGGHQRRRQRPLPRRGPSAEELEATAEMGAAASTAARDFVQQNRPTGLQLSLAALVVGMIASRRPRRPKD